MKVEDLVRLLSANGVPITADMVNEHRKIAKGEIGSNGTVDLIKYAGWLIQRQSIADEGGSIASIRSALAEICKESLKLITVPMREVLLDVAPSSMPAYSAVTRAKLCRARFLGLSVASSARCAGVGIATVRRWMDEFPDLKDDMDMAAQLANAHAAVLLRALMESDGPTALQAIKFFLTTHAPEYQERQKIEVSIDHQEVVRVIRTNLYGLGTTVDEFEGSSLLILDADTAEEEAEKASKWIEPLLALPEPPEVPKPSELIEPMRETVLEPASGSVFPLPIPPAPPPALEVVPVAAKTVQNPDWDEL